MKIIIAILIVAVLFLAMQLSVKNAEIDNFESMFNTTFRSSITQMSNAFGINFDESEESNKHFLYLYAYAGLDKAMFIYDKTSYIENNYLDVALYSLRSYMDTHSPLLNNGEYSYDYRIYELISEMQNDLSSKEKAKALYDYLFALSRE